MTQWLLQACAALQLAVCTADWTMPPADIEIHVYVMTRADIQASRARLGGPAAGGGVYAFSIPGRTTCAIFVPPLNAPEDVELWRHEIRHCLEGPSHDAWRRTKD